VTDELKIDMSGLFLLEIGAMVRPGKDGGPSADGQTRSVCGEFEFIDEFSIRAI
jgi:hypothetical protein